MKLTKRSNGDFPIMRSFFSDFFDNDKMWDFDFIPFKGMVSIPSANIKEEDNEFILELAAPGLKKQDFKIDIDNGNLTISSEKEEQKDEKDKNYTRKEYSFASFSRSFQLPEMVNQDAIKAKYEDGVLKLSLPKKAEAKAKPKKTVNIQ